MITISNGTDSFSPVTLTGYESASESRNIAHTIIGRPDPDYSLGGESTRMGTLPLMFTSVAAMEIAEAILSGTSVLTLVDDATPSVSMTFIRDGSMRRRRGRWAGSWVLEVGFREVATS